MRRAIALATFGATLGAVGSASADTGALFGDSARTAALAGAITARASELGAIGSNPGALGSLDEAMVNVTVHGGTLDLWFERDGEAEQDLSRGVAGMGAAIASPLPGPLRLVRIGVAFHVPLAHALKLVAPSRSDVPSFPLYGDSAERSAATGALAFELFDRVGLGVGVTLAPTLNAPTVVTYDAQRSTDVDDNVVVDIERELETDAAILLGVRSEVASWLALGVAYRQAVATRAVGPNDTVAGSLVVDDRIDFYDFLSPDELAFGACVGPWHGATLSLDLVRAHWSAYRTLHNEAPDPSWSDVFHVRAGVEVGAVPIMPLRLGYAYEPTPVPAQIAEHNLLDGDRHVVTVGAGLDLRQHEIPLRFDAYALAVLLVSTGAEKDDTRLGDSDPALGGQQIENLGYPGFRAGGFAAHGGLTISYFFGAPSEAP